MRVTHTHTHAAIKGKGNINATPFTFPKWTHLTETLTAFLNSSFPSLSPALQKERRRKGPFFILSAFSLSLNPAAEEGGGDDSKVKEKKLNPPHTSKNGFELFFILLYKSSGSVTSPPILPNNTVIIKSALSRIDPLHFCVAKKTDKEVNFFQKNIFCISS